jgi:hypothetical protein
VAYPAMNKHRISRRDLEVSKCRTQLLHRYGHSLGSSRVFSSLPSNRATSTTLELAVEPARAESCGPDV